ncbi:MAG: papain-like cysteine protease family protein, partial [Rhodospirillaceae bacterium]
MTTYYVARQVQKYDESCWAASIAMIVGWKKCESISEDIIAQECGCVTELTTGLSSTNLRPLRYWGFEIIRPTQCQAPSAFVNAIDKRVFGRDTWASMQPIRVC